MPVLAVGGEKSFGPIAGVIMRNVATNVQEAVVAGSGHWLMEERPAETVALIRGFLDAGSSGGGRAEKRLSPVSTSFLSLAILARGAPELRTFGPSF